MKKFIRSIFLLILAPCLGGCFNTFSASEAELTVRDTIENVDTAKSGWDYFEFGDYGAAIHSFRLAIAKTPDDDFLRLGLAESYRLSGYNTQAEIQYSKLLEENSEYRVSALTGLGHIKLNSEDSSGAFDFFSAAVEENESAWRAWLGLAQLRDLANDWKNADDAYLKALNSTNNRGLVLNNHGVSMLARKDLKSALLYFEMAAAADSSSLRIRTNYAIAQSMADSARITPTDFSHFGPKDRAVALNNIGYVAMLQGDLVKAETFFIEAIEVHPSFYAIAHKNLQTLRSKSSVN